MILIELDTSGLIDMMSVAGVAQVLVATEITSNTLYLHGSGAWYCSNDFIVVSPGRVK